MCAEDAGAARLESANDGLTRVLLVSGGRDHDLRRSEQINQPLIDVAPTSVVRYLHPETVF